MGLTINPTGGDMKASAQTLAYAPGLFRDCSADRGVDLVGFHDLSLQCLRVLRCTAHAMASGPGGLRFKAGTRPWLEGLPLPAREPVSKAF